MIVINVLRPAEPGRWTVVFHRKAENRLFSLIAMGHFKHVSAFAWVPECQAWVHYDLGFRRTRITLLPDTTKSEAYLANLIAGNAIVTMPPCSGVPRVFRFGLFCTTAVKHLIGIGGSALRPDALFASCLRNGGELSDDGSQKDRAGARSHVAA